MRFYLSSSNHLPLGEVGLRINNIADLTLNKGSIFRPLLREVYTYSETSGMAVVDFFYNQDQGAPIMMGTFGDGSTNLGVSHSPISENIEFEDALLSGAMIFSKSTSQLQSYEKGAGLKAFLRSSTRPYTIFYGFSFDEEAIFALNKKLDETTINDLDNGLLVIQDLISKVSKLIIVPPTYERIYLLSSNMVKAKSWLESVLDGSKIDWGNCSPKDFPL